MVSETYKRKIYGDARILDYRSNLNGFFYSFEVFNASYETYDSVESLDDFIVSYEQTFANVTELTSFMGSPEMQRLAASYVAQENDLMFEKHESTHSVLLSLGGQPTLIPLPMTKFFL